MLAALIVSVLLGGETSSIQEPPARLQVFLDCPSGCYADYLRDEIRFVDFVRDRVNADVHALISSAGTGAGGREYAVSLLGARSFQGIDRTVRAVTGPGDTEDMRRRHLLNAVRVALLEYLAHDGVPQNLSVDIRLATPASDAVIRSDPWNSWVFSLRGSASFEGEESNKERQVSFEGSADRITPEWKTTFGIEFEQEKEEFDLDDDEPVEVDRHERDFDWLVVKGLGEYWSVGGRGSIESSTFDNTKIRYVAAPARESGYEYDLSLSLTYTFGSIFSSIVNPRFGQ